MHDLSDRADVEQLVSTFYLSAFEDPLIGPIFTDVAKLDLGHHLPIMSDFWETVLWNAGKYRRNALQLHFALHTKHPLGSEHFERWLDIWTSNLDAQFSGPIADRAKLQATRIAGSLQRRLAGRSGSGFETIRRREL
ncbi:group III truncated hemoglobin [Gulosibacter sp. ACHW.36C]|uniref:Group III truncated hemoglobin n=1 Tax=Gulosibacter sediminis TaxID=1729695 RepID=A0ABY4MTE9_9MICO|nr:group III truncated hemoglobin [Gulosibacter sediminis]UQN13711.1 group III truncated hemoglobin [Gulosibacter sediminis]